MLLVFHSSQFASISERRALYRRPEVKIALTNKNKAATELDDRRNVSNRAPDASCAERPGH